MKVKFLNLAVLIAIIFTAVFTTPARADENQPEQPAATEVAGTETVFDTEIVAGLTETPAEEAPASTEEQVSQPAEEQAATNEPTIEFALTQEPNTQATNVPIEEETAGQPVIIIPTSTPSPEEILGLGEPAQPESQNIEQGEVAETNVEMPEGQSAEVQVEMVQAQCNDGEIVCVPNPDVTEVSVEILVNDEAEEALEEMIADAENGTDIEVFEFEVEASRRYDVEVGDYITIYNERTGSTIIAVVTDCRLGIYISVDPLVVVSSDGEVIKETHIEEDESFLDITVPDGETVSVTIDIPGRREDPVTITVTGICQTCNVVTQTATSTATSTVTSTPTIVPTTGTPEPSQTATSTPTVTATSVQVCDDEDAENYGSPVPCIYPTNTSTPTATNTPVTATPTASPTGTATGTATATNTPVITSSPEKDEENGAHDKKKVKPATPTTCTMNGEYIVIKDGEVITVREVEGKNTLNVYTLDIPLEGGSLNERITAIECRIYFSWVIQGEAQSDLYWIGFSGGAIHRVTNTPAINEMDPVIWGSALSFTAQYDDDHVNVETTDLNGNNRLITQTNAFAPAYDLTGMPTWSNSPSDENKGDWHTYSPENTALTKHGEKFLSRQGEAILVFSESLRSAYYRPAGEYAVVVNNVGELLVYPVDMDWVPSGDSIDFGQTGLEFAIWVDFGPK